MTVDNRIIELYNEYVHSALPRREFLSAGEEKIEFDGPQGKVKAFTVSTMKRAPRATTSPRRNPRGAAPGISSTRI